jgi:hypothetical protein
MINAIKTVKKEWLAVALLILVFLGIRIPAVHNSYHQDEYKWVLYAHPEWTPPGTVPHPPLTEFIYTRIGPLFGDNNFRFIPLMFGVVNIVLIFWLARIIFKSRRIAFWAAFLFTISFYSVLASLMVDVDGAVMPFFFLLMAIGYYTWKELNWKPSWWIALIIVGAIGGFLVKLSALVPVVAFALDFAFEKNVFKYKKEILKFTGYAVLAALAFVVILIGSKLIFPFFNLEYSLKYWEHFLIFENRGWFQTFIQFAKAILYTSPLLIIPAFFIDKGIWKKTRPFFFFIFVGLFFYLFAFDFSIGALDRYFEFLVVPLCIIAGAVYAHYIQNVERSKTFGVMLVVSLAIFFIQLLPHFTPPLYPKTEWLQRLVTLKWNFLFPFTGGSGPSGFYVSFLFMALMWLAALVLLVLFFTKRVTRQSLVMSLLVLGIVYNIAFIEEYAYGKINGNTSALIQHASSFIASRPEISNVTVYNDTGGWEIQAMNKYLKRLYIDPKFDIQEKVANLNKNKFYYMVVEIPYIDPTSVYARYFASCKTIYTERDSAILARVYDCRNAPDITP